MNDNHRLVSTRPLGLMYPLVFLRFVAGKIHDDAVVRNNGVYLALAVLADDSQHNGLSCAGSSY
jgi:transposase-like protein